VAVVEPATLQKAEERALPQLKAMAIAG